MKINDDEHDFDIEDFDIEIDPEEPVFPLNVVCRLLGMHYWTVHEVLEIGLIKLKKRGKRKKLFSYKNVRKLKYIRYLLRERGVNIQGIKVIFEIKEED